MRRKCGGADPAILGCGVPFGLVVVGALGVRLYAGQRGWIGSDPRLSSIVLRVGEAEQTGGIGPYQWSRPPRPGYFGPTGVGFSGIGMAFPATPMVVSTEAIGSMVFDAGAMGAPDQATYAVYRYDDEVRDAQPGAPTGRWRITGGADPVREGTLSMQAGDTVALDLAPGQYVTEVFAIYHGHRETRQGFYLHVEPSAAPCAAPWRRSCGEGW